MGEGQRPRVGLGKGPQVLAAWHVMLASVAPESR